MVKMKIVCEVCRVEGYLQHISQNYYRIRHYVGSVDGKPKFEYHKQNLEYVQRFLNQNYSPIDLIDPKNIDLKLKDSDSSKGKSLWAGSSARTEHQPPKLVVVGSNPTPPATGQ